MRLAIAVVAILALAGICILAQTLWWHFKYTTCRCRSLDGKEDRGGVGTV